MSLLFGGTPRFRSNITSITPLDVEPATVPSQEAANAAEIGRHHLMHNISRSEMRVASIHRRIVDDALTRVRD